MKKLLIAIIAILFCAVVTAQNKVVLSTSEGTPGDIVTVDVALQNSDQVTAVEVVIPLVAKQFTYIDSSCLINAERADGHQLSVAVVDGALKIYIYSISLAPLKGNEGKIASFNLKLGKAPMMYSLQPQVVLSDVAGKELPVTTTAGAVTILAPQAEVVTSVIDYGSVAIRGQYTKTFTLRNSGTLPLEVTDVQFSASEFCASETGFTIAAGATKSITVTYAPTVRGAVEESVTIISNAVNGNVSGKIVASPYSVNELHCNRVEGVAGEEVTVSLTMNNMEPIVGLQTTFNLPEQLVYVDGSFAATERAATHTAVATVKDGKLTLFLYSSKNVPVTGNDGVVATFRLRLAGYNGNYKITPQNTVLSNAGQENMTSAVRGNYIVIKSPKITGANELYMGKTPVTEKATAQYTVKNSGNAPLVINSVAFLNDGYNIADELPITIGNNSSAVLNIEYTSTEEGTYSTAMNIYSNDPVNKLKTVQVSGEIFEPNNLTFDGENMQNGDYVVSVGLENYTGIVALQMDINWIPGMTTSSDMLQVSERLAGHSCSLTKIDEDTYRFIVFSFSNKAIEGNSGKLFDLTFTPQGDVDYKDTPILIDNVILSSSGAGDYTSQQTLNAKAEYKNFFVRFVHEGEVVCEIFQRVGTPVVEPAMPEIFGYTFSHCEQLPETMPAGDIEVTAVYNKITEITVTVNQYGSATYSSKYALDFSNVKNLKAYAATGYNTSTGMVTLTRQQTTQPGMGLFISGVPGVYTVPVLEYSNDCSLNMLVGVLERTSVNSTSDDGVYYNYKYTVMSGDDTPKFYRFSDNSTLSAGKAYLQIPSAWLKSSQTKTIAIRFDDGETTGIDEVEHDDIDFVYDLQGRRVEKPANGIYIVNGKKVIIK